MENIPVFDTRPSNPLYGPLSMWLLGENPLGEGSPHPETQTELAEALGITPQKLWQIRSSKAFRKFHTDHTSSLDEIVQQRKDVLATLYATAMAGSTQAATAFLANTKNAEALAEAGRVDVQEMSPDEAANLTDAQLEAFLASQTQ